MAKRLGRINHARRADIWIGRFRLIQNTIINRMEQFNGFSLDKKENFSERGAQKRRMTNKHYGRRAS